jgi:hypothetical protein
MEWSSIRRRRKPRHPECSRRSGQTAPRTETSTPRIRERRRRASDLGNSAACDYLSRGLLSCHARHGWRRVLGIAGFMFPLAPVDRPTPQANPGRTLDLQLANEICQNLMSAVCPRIRGQLLLGQSVGIASSAIASSSGASARSCSSSNVRAPRSRRAGSGIHCAGSESRARPGGRLPC